MHNLNNPKFIKWAGGKSQLIDQFKLYFPKKINRYFEPFLGSGAVFFYIIQNYKPKEVFLSDINKELIDTYKIIRDDVERLIVELRQHKEYHLVKGKRYYLTIRSTNPNTLPSLERAARFIYLNKTCFNGLYRVNSKNEFNVPMGNYKNPDIVQKDRLRFASKLLQNVNITVMDFNDILTIVKKNDFIYFDPPYSPLEGKSSFTSYSKNNFLDKDQISLKNLYDKLNAKKCFLMLSNSDTSFIKDLYHHYNISFVNAKRMINSNAKDRGKIKEVVVTNY